MPKLAEAAQTLVHYIEVAYNRGGTGPTITTEMRAELNYAIKAFEAVDHFLGQPYPPIDEAEIVECFVFDNVFDRIVVARTGIYGRKLGTNVWTRLRTLAEQELIEEAKRKADEAAAAAKDAQEAVGPVL